MGSRRGIATYIAAMVSITLWGFSYIWNNQLIALQIPIFYFVFIRVLLAGVILLLFNLATRQFRPIRREHLLLFLLLSVCEPFIYFIAETYGIKETGSPTISSMIIASVPVFSMIAGAVIFKEKVTFLNIAGLGVTLLGLALVLFSKIDEGVGEHFVLGIVLLVVAVLIEVAYASITKRLSCSYSPQVIVMYQFLIGSVYFLPVFLTEGLETFTPEFVSWPVMKPILCLALLCSSLAFTLWASTIRSLGVARSSVFLALISVVTAFGSVTLGQESLCAMQWVGIAVSVVGIVLSQYTGRGSEATGTCDTAA